MDTAELKPPHKFFDRVLDLNLEELTDSCMKLREDMLYHNIFAVPEDVMAARFNVKENPQVEITMLADYYNIFLLENKNIKKLYDALQEVTVEACEYYGVEYKDYAIRGWVNVTYSPIDNPSDPIPEEYDGALNYHEHMGGSGAPDFHGYYCVNAEPSSTYYLINKEEKKANINKNNRLVVSETGHPHRVGPWISSTPRITIAYDIAPRANMGNKFALLSI